jgi:hypothetical protein
MRYWNHKAAISIQQTMTETNKEQQYHHRLVITKRFPISDRYNYDYLAPPTIICFRTSNLPATIFIYYYYLYFK